MTLACHPEFADFDVFQAKTTDELMSIARERFETDSTTPRWRKLIVVGFISICASMVQVSNSLVAAFGVHYTAMLCMQLPNPSVNPDRKQRLPRLVPPRCSPGGGYLWR